MAAHEGVASLFATTDDLQALPVLTDEALLAVRQFHGDIDMKFKPLHDRVVVEPSQQDEKTAGGIIIPGNAQEKPMQGKVLKAGPGARSEDGKLQAMDVKKGDVVLYGKWSGTEVKLDGKDVLIMRESDIMGVLD